VASAQARLLMDPSRDPLPAGHTVTWTAITAGTALAGTGYHDAGYDCPTDIASNWNKS
jgi:hypothetical protein